jgi:hypothetical protein
VCVKTDHFVIIRTTFRLIVFDQTRDQAATGEAVQIQNRSVPVDRREIDTAPDKVLTEKMI